MKTYPLRHTTVALASALFLGSAATLPAQLGMPPQPVSNLQVATATATESSFEKFIGQPLRGVNQEDFGTITDFLVNPQSGQLHFLAVTSGEGMTGQTYRIVPISALSSTTSDSLTTRLAKAEWDKVGTLTEAQLRDLSNIEPDHLQRLSQQFSLGQSPGGGLEPGAESVVRLTDMKGKEIRSGNESVGRISDIMLDMGQRLAMPVIEPSGSFGTSGQQYIVPFTQLQFSPGGPGGQGTITTALTRNDFQQAQPSPTGYMGSGQQQLNAAATAVQQAITQNPAFAAAGVQVIPESRIVLRGTVENTSRKAEIEQAARQAAPGVRVDSELTVRGW